MNSLWPWLAVAGLGAFHGLSPASGWMFAAACGVHARDAGQARRALLPIAAGHAASVALVAAAVAQGLWMDGVLFQRLAGALLVGVAACRLLRGGGSGPALGREAGKAGIAAWSFLMASAQGTGMMLVPALVPLCLSGSPAAAITASGSLPLAAAAVGVHTAAMLAATGLIATGVCRGLAGRAWLGQLAMSRAAWTGALFGAGLLLLATA
jgi:hypothetical protein